MSTASRERFSRGIGFTLAAVGSAVGLGNMWRFSYMTAENGGAAFVLVYVFMTLLVGLPVLLAELTLGRGAGRSPVQAFVHFSTVRYAPLGWLAVLTPFVILSYYSVIAGWTLRYAVEGVLGGFSADAGAYFGRVSEGWDAVGWHLVFMAITVGVVSGGVRAGIERAALVLMPVLGLLVVGLAVYAASLDGSGAGYRYYFATDFSGISFDVAKDAASQAFFSLSLGMGAIITYASYLERDHDLPRESALIAVSDFSIALVAGLVIFPILFALSLQGEILGGETGTLGALFVVLPKAFAMMGGAGTAVGGLFMVALAVAGLTSAISLLEVVVSTAMDVQGMARRRAALWLGGAVALLGIPSALSIGVLDFVDSLGGALFLVLGGLGTSLFVGWRMADPVGEARGRGAPGALALWRFLLRWLVPPVLVVMAGFLAVASMDKLRGLLAG